jgi:hypothetical protein
MKQIPFNLGGNLCGHDKQAPDFRLVRPIKTGVAGIPLVLIMAVQRLTGYYDRPTLLPSLNRVNDSDRQQRSERREACIVTLASVLKYTDLSSLRVGIQTVEGFRPWSLKMIHRATGLSWSRFERAWLDLKAAGIVSSSQKKAILKDNEWHYEIAVKALNASLFSALGLGSMLKKERKKAVRRQRVVLDAEAARVNRTGQGRTRLYLSSLAEKMKNRSGKKPKQVTLPEQPHTLSLAQRKAYSFKYAELWERFKTTLSKDEIKALAIKAIS